MLNDAKESEDEEKTMNEYDIDLAEKFASQEADETTIPAWTATTDEF